MRDEAPIDSRDELEKRPVLHNNRQSESVAAVVRLLLPRYSYS